MLETDKAWSAGIIEGEGCIGIYRCNKNSFSRYNFRLSVANTNILMIEQLKSLWGGRIYSHWPKADSKAWRKVWSWQLRGKEATKLLKIIFPYLITKKEEAELAIEFGNTLTKGNPSNKIPRHIKFLRVLIADELKKCKHTERKIA